MGCLSGLSIRVTTDRMSQTFVEEDVFLKSNCSADATDSESAALFLQLNDPCHLGERKRTVHVEWLSQLKATVTIKAPRGTFPPKASELLPMDPEVYAAKLTSFESKDRSDILLQGLRVVSPQEL